MPPNNAFRHQEYGSGPPASGYELLCPKPVDLADSESFREQLAAAGERLSDAKVAAIHLIHGTLMGTDALGLIGVLARFLPEWTSSLRQQQKQLVDSIVGDWANYDEDFANVFREGVNARLTQAQAIEVRRFLWSSENNHTGRADAAVQLIDQLHQGNYGEGQRIQLWGHSHGGNVMALVSNLLAGDMRTRAAFFKAPKPLYRRSSNRLIDLPSWGRVRELLSKEGNPLEHLRMDMVTFGTPVRYGWDTDGYDRLIHFNNHRPTEGTPEYLAPFPPSVEQIQGASAGDFVQQFFIAGTNFPVNLFAWRNWRAERKLQKLLQSGHSRRDLWTRLIAGVRVPTEGRSLLVDYATSDAALAQSVFGHGVYTKPEFIPFHLDQILSRLGDSRV